jgi:quercetin dioxygenase-like cupin family protein
MEERMRNHLIGAIALTLAVTSVIGAQPPVAADRPAVVRKMLVQQDLAIPGNHTMALVSVEIAVGGREGRHTHPGALAGYVLEGVVSFDLEGKPSVIYKAGDAFFIEAGRIHEGINVGTAPAKAIATFILPKGQPLTAAVP